MTVIILSAQANGSFSLTFFYWSRIKRIVPAYMVLLATTTAVMALLLTPSDFRGFRNSALASLGFGTNLYFQERADYFAPNASEMPLLHLWSLAIEMQFYVFFPLLVLVVPRKFLAPVFTLVTATLFLWASLELAAGNNDGIYFSLIARIPEFLVGALVALIVLGKSAQLKLREPLGLLGIFLVLTSALFLSDTTPFPGINAIPVTIGTALIILARPVFLQAVLSSKPMQRIGDMSYSLYLWHWPIFATARYVLETYKLPPLIAGFSLLLTFLLAFLSWRFIEQPFRERSISASGLISVLSIPIVAAAVHLSGASINQFLVQPQPVELSRYANPSDICHSKLLDSCTRGDPGAGKHVLVMGDSHAAQLNLFTDEIGRKDGIRFTVISSSSCVPIRGKTLDSLDQGVSEPCRRQKEAIEDSIYDYDAIIVAGRWLTHGANDSFVEDFRSFLKARNDSGQPILVLGQVPELSNNPQRLYRFSELGFVKEPEVRLDGWLEGNQNIEKITKEFRNVDFISLANSAVFDTAPFFEGSSLYFDVHHLNEYGSKMLGAKSGSIVTDWIAASVFVR